jgi:hypothetical protein
LTNENSDTFRLHFLHHLRAVALDRARADVEPFCNCLAGESLSNEIENLHLTRRQPCKLCWEMIGRLLFELLGKSARQPAIDRRRELSVIDWFLNEVLCACLDTSNRHRHVSVS